MGLVYGIDFGTSSSAIMVGRPGRDDVIRIRNPVDNTYEVPSAVYLRPDGVMIAGTAAKRVRLQRPAQYLDDFKREIGSSTPVVFPPDKPGGAASPYPAYQLVAHVLRLLHDEARKVAPEEPEVVVITVPASWEEGNREEMREAAREAGFEPDSVRLLSEPEAAIAYVVQEHLATEERTFLVYDLGGGTFDCAVARGHGRLGHTVLGQPGGLPDCGGIAFDIEIHKAIEQRFPEQVGRLRESEDVPTLQKRLQLRDSCETIKRTLSSYDSYTGLLTELAVDAEFTMTRKDLARLLSPLLDETLDECERVLRAQGLEWADLDAVLPVGGSTRLPVVREAIAARSETPVHVVYEPELAVVHGAVLHGFGPLPTSPAPMTVAGTPRETLIPETPAVLPEPDEHEVFEEPEQEELSERDWRALLELGCDREPAAPESTSESAESAPEPESEPVVLEREPAPVPVALPESVPELVDKPASDSQFFAVWAVRWVTLARKVRNTALFFSLLAVLLAITDLVTTYTDLTIAATTQEQLRMDLSILAVFNAVLMALGAWANNRALLAWWWLTASAVGTLGIAGAYSLMTGVPRTVALWLLIPMVIVLFLGGSFGEIPLASEQKTALEVGSSAISVHFGNGMVVHLYWAEIDTVYAPRGGMLTVTMREEPERAYWPLVYTSEINGFRIFGKYDFHEPKTVTEALRMYGGTHVRRLW